MGWAELFEHARRDQHGVVLARQAPEFGISPATFSRRAAEESWQVLFRGARLLPGAVPTLESRVSAALLLAGDRSAAGRRTAAYLHGMLDRRPSQIEVVVPYGRAVPTLGPGAAAWRSRTLLTGDVTTVRGLRVTSPRRTLCDLAPCETVADLRALLIDAEQRRIVRQSAVLSRTFDLRGSPGMPKLRRVLWELDREHCDSVFVYLVRRALIQAGMRPDHLGGLEPLRPRPRRLPRRGPCRARRPRLAELTRDRAELASHVSGTPHDPGPEVTST